MYGEHIKILSLFISVPIIVPVFFAASVSFVWYFAQRYFFRRNTSKSKLPLMRAATTIALRLWAVATLGIVVGTVAGLSREPVVGATITAILGLISGLIVFLFAEKRTTDRSAVAATIGFLAVFILTGCGYGALVREEYNSYRGSVSYLAKEAMIQYEIQEFREALGLSNVINR